MSNVLQEMEYQEWSDEQKAVARAGLFAEVESLRDKYMDKGADEEREHNRKEVKEMLERIRSTVKEIEPLIHMMLDTGRTLQARAQAEKELEAALKLLREEDCPI